MVTGTLEARKSPEAGERTVAARPALVTRLRQLGTLALINLALISLLVIDSIGEIVAYQTAWILLGAVPGGLIFGCAAYVQSHSTEPSTRWLRIAGWTSAAFAVLCGLSFWGSLMQPVDIACAIASAGLGVAFAGAAWYQLPAVMR